MPREALQEPHVLPARSLLATGEDHSFCSENSNLGTQLGREYGARSWQFLPEAAAQELTYHGTLHGAGSEERSSQVVGQPGTSQESHWVDVGHRSIHPMA